MKDQHELLAKYRRQKARRLEVCRVLGFRGLGLRGLGALGLLGLVLRALQVFDRSSRGFDSSFLLGHAAAVAQGQRGKPAAKGCQALGFQGLGLRVQGLRGQGLKAQALRVQGLGFSLQQNGFRVKGLESRV